MPPSSKLHNIDAENLCTFCEKPTPQKKLLKLWAKSGRDGGPSRVRTTNKVSPRHRRLCPWLSVSVVEEMASFLWTKENRRAEVQAPSGSHCGWNSECSQLGCFLKRRESCSWTDRHCCTLQLGPKRASRIQRLSVSLKKMIFANVLSQIP